MATPVIGTPTYYRDSLAEVNLAISAAMRGQRYKIGDREVWRADLEWLYAERTRLEPLAAGECRPRTTGRIRRVVPL
jgi:hypothetical protein